MTIDQQETDRSKIIDRLAGLDAKGIAVELQRITDDAKYDIRDGDEQHLLAYVNELRAIAGLLYGKYDRLRPRSHPEGLAVIE